MVGRLTMENDTLNEIIKLVEPQKCDFSPKAYHLNNVFSASCTARKTYNASYSKKRLGGKIWFIGR